MARWGSVYVGRPARWKDSHQAVEVRATGLVVSA